MTAVTETLPSRGVLFWDPCRTCSVRSMTSTDGLTCRCQNCGHEGTTGGLERNRGYDSLHEQKVDTNVVYYLRFGDRVKIGTTANLAERMQAIPYDELLAVEPGSFETERERHQQFRAARIYANREWFHYTDEIRQHIAGLT